MTVLGEPTEIRDRALDLLDLITDTLDPEEFTAAEVRRHFDAHFDDYMKLLVYLVNQKLITCDENYLFGVTKEGEKALRAKEA